MMYFKSFLEICERNLWTQLGFFFLRDALGTLLKLLIEQSCVYRNVLKDKILGTTHSEVSIAIEISWSQQ